MAVIPIIADRLLLQLLWGKDQRRKVKENVNTVLGMDHGDCDPPYSFHLRGRSDDVGEREKLLLKLKRVQNGKDPRP